MNDRAEPTVPASLIEQLEASVSDLARGRVTDAADVQIEMRRMLADYEAAHPPAPAARRPGAAS